MGRGVKAWILPGLVVTALAAVAIFGGVKYSRIEPVASNADRNPADIGRTIPNTLLVFEDWPGAPAFCRSPDQVLDRLRTAVLDVGPIGDATGCTASLAGDPASGSQLSLMCPVSAGQDGCVDRYTAQVWVERDRRSFANYKVRGFGWIQRSCGGSDAAYEALDTSMSRGTSSTIEAVLHQCRDPEARSSR